MILSRSLQSPQFWRCYPDQVTWWDHPTGFCYPLGICYLPTSRQQTAVLSLLAITRHVYDLALLAQRSLWDDTFEQVPPFSYNLLALSAVQTSVDTDSTHLRCEELIEVLQQNGCYETEEGMRRRQNLISEMDTLVKQWIRIICLSKIMNLQDAEQVRDCI